MQGINKFAKKQTWVIRILFLFINSWPFAVKDMLFEIFS